MKALRTILVIDDDEKFSFGLVSMLRRNGYQVLTATNGAQGLEIIRSKGKLHPGQAVCLPLMLLCLRMAVIGIVYCRRSTAINLIKDSN